MNRFLTILLFIIFSTVNQGYSQCLSGIYTIGGSSPSYATINNAISALTTNGICGPVLFNIRSGIYNEQINIPQITGSSSTNTITFQSELLDSSAVTIQYSSNSSNNYVVRLSGADYIKFQKIKLKSTNSTYSIVIQIQQNSDNTEINNCQIEGPTISIFNSNKILITTNSNDNENISINNNYFSGSARAIGLTGNATTPTNIQIKNNQFQNHFNSAIALSSINSPRIENNNINLTSSSVDGAILLYSCKDSTVIKNNKLSLLSGHGIYSDFLTGHSLQKAIIANNIINNSGNSNGISFNTPVNIMLVHNTIVINGTNNSNFCINATSINNSNIIENNIFYQKGIGKIYILSTNGSAISNHNSLFCSGSTFGVFNNINYSSFVGWKDSVLIDTNSVSSIPQFVSQNDFHILSDFSQNLTLPFFSQVPNDLDGIARDQSSPYFGAYEYFNQTNTTDIGVSKISSPNTLTCSGTSPVSIVLKNYGSNLLTSAIINWSVNNIQQTPYNWYGSLSLYDTNNINIGTLNIPQLSIQTIKAWTTLPNGIIDSVNYNDTISKTVYAKMSGSYTIGGINPNYTTITSAINDLQNRTICGNVILNIRAGTYNEAIIINPISGSNSANTITLQAENGINTSVLITNTSGTAVNINQSDNIILKDLSIGSTSTPFYAIQIGNSSNNIEVNNCRIASQNTSAIYSSQASAISTKISILNNYFETPSYNINLTTTGTSRYQNVKIENNIFTGGQIFIRNMDTLFYNKNTSINTTAPTATFSYINQGTIKNSTFSSNQSYALSLESLSNIIVANNLIRFSGMGSNQNAFIQTTCGELKFLNNSILCLSANLSAAAMNINSSALGTNNKYWNNIIVNQGPGLVIRSGLPMEVSLKNNVYYGNGNYFGSNQGTNINTFYDWINFSTRDTNSIEINPIYTSNFDLHANEILINNSGVDVTNWITEDFNNQIRNNPPDIGAYEFTPLATDAGLNKLLFQQTLCTGNTPVQVYLKNNGTSTLNSATISYQINSVLQPTYSWSGSLLPGNEVQITIGNYNFLPNTSYSAIAYVSNPNGIADILSQNDTAKKYFAGTALSGVYTIGGSAPNFTTINNAVNALKNGGVCGPVIFNLRDGTYNEQVRIPFLIGTSATNTVTFQSESLDSTLVKIEYNSTSSLSNYTVKIDTVDYIILNKLSIKSLNLSYSTAINLSNSADHISITNCILSSPTNGSSSLLDIQNADFCNIRSNKLYNSATAISMAGGAEVSVVKNYFEGQTSKGINSNGLNLEYSENTFHYPTSPYISVISFNGSASKGKINKNKILVNTASIGIELSSILDTVIISNNFIIGGNGGTGINITNCSKVQILNNSIFQQGYSKCMAMYSSTFCIISNNIFYNTSNTAYSLIISYGCTNLQSNYNCIYNPYNLLVNYFGNNYTSLAAYNAVSGNEANSVSVEPYFSSLTDLHVNTQQLDGTGTSNSNVIDDIDSELRNISTPDIGADEFTYSPIQNDVLLVNIYVSNSNCSGNNTIYAKIKNMASDTLHSLKFATIHQNLTQPIFNWTGNLAQGQIVDSIPVATIPYSYGSNTMKVWAFDPNGNVDENNINDTLTLTQSNVPLSGSYTIGGVSPDFTTIRQAATALRQYGICNNTIFNIRPGTYTDSLTIFSINGTANYNVTFKSENNDSTSVVLTDFATSNGSINSIIRLTAVQNFTFEKITFQKNLTTTATDNSAIHIRTGGTNNISIKNCRFIGNNSAASGIYMYYSNNLNNIKIKNNLFIDITYGVYINNSSGSIDIHSNTFQNCGIAGIYGKDYSGVCSISKNYFHTTTTNSSIIGIKSSNINNPKIDRNIFEMKTGCAMHLGNSSYMIENNFIKIDSINNLTNGSAIYLYSTSNTSQLSFNTVRARIFNTTNYSLKTQSTASIIGKNNIILNLGTQGGIVYMDSPNTILNNNRYFTLSNTFGNVNSTSYSTLNSWKTGTGNDYNSQYKQTYFTGDPGYEIIGDYGLNNSGVAISGITTDIRDSLRNPLTPDIGAYEFNLFPIDAEIKNLKTNDSLLCSGNNPVTITIRNSGLTAINNLNINWIVNNVTQTPATFSGTLNSGDTADVVLGNYNFRGGNTYKLKIYSSLPNGVPDSSNFNDTLFIPSIKTRFSGIYTIGGSNPDFSTFKDAVDTLLLCGLCGPSTFNFRAGNYTSNFTIPTIIGSSSINSVTFQSELLDSSQVSIIDNGPSLTLNGTKNINFKHLSFQQNLANNNSTISIVGNAKNITISNCSFNNPNGTTTIGTVNATFADSTSGNFTLTNCLFGVNTKLTISSNPYLPSPKNFFITNNNFLNTNETQIINIEELEYKRNSNNSDVKILANTNFSISNNRITNGNLTITTGNLFHRKEIFNNIIDSGRIKITSTSPITIMHNTIVSDNINNLNPINGCINFVGKIQHSKIYNNIFSVRNGNNVYTIDDPSFTAGNNDTIFDYNVVYTSGDTVTYSFNSPNEIKKSQWISNYRQDQHSSFFKPEFTGINDFHPINDYHNNNRGIGDVLYNTDFDGIIRNPFNPDPGVYEFDVIQTANDAGILSSTVEYCGSASNPIDVILKNYGNNPIDSVEIHWTLNGLAQAPYQWQGSLQPDSMINVTVGSFTPSMTNNNNLVFFTSMPNGVIDSNTSNDSLSLNGHSSSLSGIYTIGGTGADFNSFFDATNTLSQVGICGPTEFIIANGNYFNTAYLSALQNITGNNENNTITFRSQSGNPSSVTLDLTAYTITAGNLLIQNVTGITFKDLTIIGTIELGANAKNIKFIGNKFNASSLALITNYIVKSSAYNENIEFINNKFIGTNMAFDYDHPNTTTAFPKKLTIRGNIFENAFNPIEINNVDSLVIDSNMFYRTGAIVTNSHAIRVLSPKNHFEITRNIINGDFEKGIETGIKNIPTSLKESMISNNVIILNNPLSYTGIDCWTDSLNIYYNTIRTSSTNSNAISVHVVSHLKIKNNIFYSDSGKLISKTVSTWQIESDYNVFYTTSPIIVSASSTNYPTLSSYSSATGMDTHSLFLDPQFVSNTSDLHYLNLALNGTATPLSLVPYDQQNHLRNISTPNPGAYETAADTIYDSTKTYLTVKRLVNDTLVIGTNSLSTVINFDIPPHTDTNYYKYTARIDSLRIHYKVNHHPEVTETWQGTMRIGDSLIYTFNTPLNIPNGKRYDVKVWVENLTPLQTEIEFSDDSIHKQINMPMLGDYTIGGINPDFRTYFDTYMSQYYCGTIGDVKYLYRTGVYSEDIRIDGNSTNSILGSIEYTSETGNSDDVNIRLQWAIGYNVLKFTKLTITPYTDNAAVYTDDGPEIRGAFTIFDSCKFVGGTALDEKNGLFFKKPYNQSSAEIKNCEFHNLKFAINLSNILDYFSTNANNDFVFENNLIDSCEKGILLKDYNDGSGMYNGKNLIIRNNKINTSNTGIEISGNGVSKMILENNYINSNEKGINATAPVSVSKFINNMINSKDYNFLSSLTRSKLYHNTYNKMLWINNPIDSLEQYNNVFFTDSTSVALFISYTNNFVMRSDNNNYYTPNNPFISRIGDFFAGSYTDYASPQDMISALFIDSNSVNFNPLFLSNTDLHSQSSNLKGLAKSFSFIDTDIDGESRLLNAPDIGADEINLIVTDVWPGDTDKDNSVTNYDILPIGLFYGYTGSPRASISNAWQQYPSMDWGIGLSSGYDIKHIDCNGDGTIDNSDTLAVNLNYNLTHSFSPTDQDTRLINPPLYWITSAPNYTGGDTVVAELHIGDFNTPVDSIYSIAFDISYNSSIIQNNSETLEYTNNWLGTLGTNEIKISKINPSSNIAMGAISRIDHINVSGFGKIATFKFVLNNSIYPGSTLPINVINYVALKNDGDTLALSSVPLNINLIPNTVGTNEIVNIQNIYIAPNPFNNSTSINYSLDRDSDVKIEILNSIGQIIDSKIDNNQPPGAYTYIFNLKSKGYETGVYLVKATINGITTTKKIIGTK